MAMGSVGFNAWLLGLFVFEYEKEQLILDQATRENLPEASDGGPKSRDDVFPRGNQDDVVNLWEPSIRSTISLTQPIKSLKRKTQIRYHQHLAWIYWYLIIYLS